MFRRMFSGSKPAPRTAKGPSADPRLYGKQSQVPSPATSASTSSGPPSPGPSSRASAGCYPGLGGGGAGSRAAASSCLPVPGLGGGGACAAAEDRSVLTVVRSALWSEVGDEDVWKVEVRSSANVAELKARISALYQIPVQAQRLQRTGDPGDPCLPDKALVSDFERQPIYLLPALEAKQRSAPRGEAAGGELDGIELDVDPDYVTEEEQMEKLRALAESLQGVKYGVTVIRPRDPAGAFKEASVQLKFDAMALVGDAQATAEGELLGPEGEDRPWCLLLNGQALPPNVPLHFAGVAEGATLILVPAGPTEEDGDPDSDSDSLDDAILNWANAK